MIYPEKLFKDPQQDVLVRPYNDTIIMESHGSKLFLRIHIPAFDDMESTCPVVLMLHGYPGNERNFDIAQSLRMAGMAVVQFSYRGVWGAHGYYSFTHIIEDTLAVAECIIERAAEYRIDPERLYLFGHSVGGFAAVNSMAKGLPAAGAVLLSPCDMAFKYLHRPEECNNLMESQTKGYFNIPHDTYIVDNLAANADEWLFVNAAEHLKTDIPYAFIGGTRDGLTPADGHIFPLMEKMKDRGANVSYVEFDDGHDYPATRMQLTRQIVSFLAEMDQK